MFGNKKLQRTILLHKATKLFSHKNHTYPRSETSLSPQNVVFHIDADTNIKLIIARLTKTEKN